MYTNVLALRVFTELPVLVFFRVLEAQVLHLLYLASKMCLACHEIGAKRTINHNVLYSLTDV